MLIRLLRIRYLFSKSTISVKRSPGLSCLCRSGRNLNANDAIRRAWRCKWGCQYVSETLCCDVRSCTRKGPGENGLNSGTNTSDQVNDLQYRSITSNEIDESGKCTIYCLK